MNQMKTKTLLSLILLTLVTFSACKKDSNDCIDGNGTLVIDTRNPGDFDQVIANGAYHINFSIAPEARIDLFGDENILPVITTNVSSNVLVISTQNDQCYNATQTIEATLTSKAMKSVVLNGAGSIVGNGIIQDGLVYEVNGSAIINSSFQVQEHATTINGSGDATLVGEATTASFNISGAGNILASTLQTENCIIVISGTGDVRIHATKTLHVTISGSGSVFYTGDPEITSTITGSGELVKVG
jgi:hypothetical protein